MTAKMVGTEYAVSGMGKAPAQWVFVELEELFDGVRDEICRGLAEHLKESDLLKIERLLMRCGLCASPLQAAHAVASASGAKTATIDAVVGRVGDRIRAWMAVDPPRLRPAYEVALKAARERNRGIVALTTLPKDFAEPLFQRPGAGLTAQVRAVPIPEDGTFPTVEQWRSAVQSVGASPAQSIALVTTRTSFKTALVAGVHCIALPDRFTQAQDFSGAVRVIEYGQEPDEGTWVGVL